MSNFAQSIVLMALATAFSLVFLGLAVFSLMNSVYLVAFLFMFSFVFIFGTNLYLFFRTLTTFLGTSK